MKINEPGEADTRNSEFLAADEADKAIFWPTPGFNEGTFDSSGFSLEGNLTSASSVPTIDWVSNAESQSADESTRSRQYREVS